MKKSVAYIKKLLGVKSPSTGGYEYDRRKRREGEKIAWGKEKRKYQ